MVMEERQYEVILFGATGYTGRLTAEHITTHLPTDLKWALAGRSANKLSALAKEIQSLNSNRLQPGIEVAELKPQDLDVLAKKTKLLITVVGPYALYGMPVVEACARNGTHYLDVTGETPWVKEVVDKWHETAKASGAIMIPQIGIESAPADLVSWSLVTFLRERFALPTKEVIFSTHEMNATPSGGTSATILSILDVYNSKQLREAFKPWALSPIPGPRYPNPAGPLGGRKVPELGTLATWVTGTTDRSIVHRSWGLIGGGEVYGRKFRFSPYMRVRNGLIGAMQHLAIVFGVLALAIPPVRWILRKLIYAPGAGPDKEATEKESIEFRGLAVADQDSPKPRRALSRMRYDGGMYYLTGVFLAEAAFVLLRGQEEIEARKLGGGVLTPATLGQPLIDRLQKAGLVLETSLLED